MIPLEIFLVASSLSISVLAALIFRAFDKIDDGSEIRKHMLWLFAAKSWTYFVIGFGITVLFAFDIIRDETIIWLAIILTLAHIPKVIVMWLLWRYIVGLGK